MSKNSKNQKFNLIIIGGGAAGMMAAISARRNNPNISIAILDRTFQLGRKILVCGAGRCNITNKNLDSSIEDHYYGASNKFLDSVFKQFGYKDIVNFFRDLGIELYTERKTDIGKVFPVTDKATTVTELLLDELVRANVQIFLNTQVTDIISHSSVSNLKQTEKWFSIKTNSVNRDGTLDANESSEFSADKVILSAGGRSYPALGSNGSGYDLASKLGHSIVDPVPSALPLEASSQLIHYLQGVKLEVEVTSIIGGKSVKTRTDDVMFTNYGLSGPAILNVSREFSIHFNREKKSNCQVRLNFFPRKTKDEAKHILRSRWQKRPDQGIEKSLYGLFPNKFASGLLKTIKIDGFKVVGLLTNEEVNRVVNSLCDYRIDIKGTRGWNEAEFTAGGIDTSEVNAETLESKLSPGIFFCGEILNVDGDVGGFNLSWSWSSGYVAGRSAI